MFGCLVAGRLVQTNLQEIDETHCAFQLENASSINHICVFLLGTVPFPSGYAATVHFFWPGKGFQLLGMLSNEKPSAIFRVRGTFGVSDYAQSRRFTQNFQQSQALIPGSTAAESVTALLGIAIEPLDAVMSQISTLPSSAKSVADPVVLAERIARHLLNFTSSFGMTSIPQRAIEQWYESFCGKVRAMGTSFLERTD